MSKSSLPLTDASACEVAALVREPLSAEAVDDIAATLKAHTDIATGATV